MNCISLDKVLRHMPMPKIDIIIHAMTANLAKSKLILLCMNAIATSDGNLKLVSALRTFSSSHINW